MGTWLFSISLRQRSTTQLCSVSQFNRINNNCACVCTLPDLHRGSWEASHSRLQRYVCATDTVPPISKCRNWNLARMSMKPSTFWMILGCWRTDLQTWHPPGGGTYSDASPCTQTTAWPFIAGLRSEPRFDRSKANVLTLSCPASLLQSEYPFYSLSVVGERAGCLPTSRWQHGNSRILNVVLSDVWFVQMVSLVPRPLSTLENFCAQQDITIWGPSVCIVASVGLNWKLTFSLGSSTTNACATWYLTSIRWVGFLKKNII